MNHRLPDGDPGNEADLAGITPTGKGALRIMVAALFSGVLALSSRAHGPLHERIVALTEELAAHPEDVGRLALRGELFRLHGLWSEARVDFEQVARLRPADVTNDFRLGRLDLESRETNSAVARLTRFAAAAPGDVAGRFALARALVLAGKPAEAIPHFSAALMAGTETRPEWFLERTQAARCAGAPVEAVLAGLDEGIARFGPLPLLQLPAVELEVQRGAIPAALARLDAIAARAERKERWLYRRGEVLRQAGRSAEARREYLAARDSLDRLPDKLRRAWVATELRQQVEARLAELDASPVKPEPGR